MSAVYFFKISTGSTTLPKDFDILAPVEREASRGISVLDGVLIPDKNITVVPDKNTTVVPDHQQQKLSYTCTVNVVPFLSMTKPCAYTPLGKGTSADINMMGQ